MLRLLCAGFSLSLLVLLARCSERLPEPSKSARDQLFLAVISYHVSEWSDWEREHAGTVFIRLENNDPSPSFLRELSTIPYPVRPASEFEMGRGTQVHVYSLQRLDQDNYAVEVSDHAGRMLYAVYSIRVRWRGTEFHVIDRDYVSGA